MVLSTKRPQQLLITSTQFQIAGTLHRSLLKQCKKQKASQIRQMNVNGVVCNNFLFDHQHLEAASVHGGTHPCRVCRATCRWRSLRWLSISKIEIKPVFAAESEHRCGEIKSSLAPGCLKSPVAFLDPNPWWWQIEKTTLWCSSTAITAAEQWKNRLKRHFLVV